MKKTIVSDYCEVNYTSPNLSVKYTSKLQKLNDSNKYKRRRKLTIIDNNKNSDCNQNSNSKT